MASEALQANSQSLTALAQASLEKTNEQVKGDLDRRQAAIADLVRPLADTLQAVDLKLGAVEKDRIAANASLAEQLKQVGSGLTRCRAKPASSSRRSVSRTCAATGAKSSCARSWNWPA